MQSTELQYHALHFAVALHNNKATLKSLDYNVVMTFSFNNN